ncbi:MAG TPA: fumarylacetoacetate hydrolase family protein [Pseudomonadota bacterium]|nr:fumarylacetoacetate hydrolase family protein [Xanthomonadales bacterium]HQW82219.1 fumarylacetoacetate hydrolase family protein [Pseudomonadota bacterium]
MTAVPHRYAVPAAPVTSIPISGTDARFPVHRIYCIGRNYEEHAREMNATVALDAPVFFMKPSDAVVTDGADVPFPSATNDLHHEVELVLALHSGGRNLDTAVARAAIYGYAVGLDLTRRDLQAKAKAKGTPWDTAKGFDASAPISAITPVAMIGHPAAGELRLQVNGQIRQHANIATMVMAPADILASLSNFYELRAGDLIFTGTPAGVAALHRGDTFVATFPGLADLRGRIV